MYALHGHLDFMGFYSKLDNLIIQFFLGLASCDIFNTIGLRRLAAQVEII